MKIIFTLLGLLGAGGLLASPAPVKLGPETNYTATALADIGTMYAPNTSSSTGSFNSERGVEIVYGYVVRQVEPASLLTTMSLLQYRLRQALLSDQWKTSLAVDPLAEPQGPLFFITTAAKGSESLELYVCLFPTPDGLVKIAYEQRRSFPEPDQPAPPTPPKGG